MIRSVMAPMVVVGLILGAPLAAAPCKNAAGKFVACKPIAARLSRPHSGIVKDKNGRCRVAAGPKKGQFTKCK